MATDGEAGGAGRAARKPAELWEAGGGGREVAGDITRGGAAAGGGSPGSGGGAGKAPAAGGGRGAPALGRRTGEGAGGRRPPARLRRSRAARPGGRAADRGAGGKPPGRVPGRSLLRFLVLETLAAGGSVDMLGVATRIAVAHLGAGGATLDAYLAGGRGTELDRGVRLAAGDMAHAGLVRLGPGGRMQIAAGGKALLDKIGEMGGAGGSAGEQALEGDAGGWKTKPAISNEFLRRLSPAYREWQDGGPAEGQPSRVTGGSAKISNGIVATIDMLGASEAWRTRDQVELHHLWTELIGLAKRVLRPKDGFAVTAESDAIKVTGSGRSAADLLEAFGRSSWRIVVRGLQIGVPVRGCVAEGEYCAGNTGLVTGRAVAVAKEWHDRAQWIGIAAAPSAGDVLDGMERAGAGSVRECYVKYDIPSKSGTDEGWAVNWPRQCEETGMGGGAAAMMRIIRDSRKRAPDESAALKWANTGEFCNRMIRRRSPFE